MSSILNLASGRNYYSLGMIYFVIIVATKSNDMSNDKAKVAGTVPIPVDLEEGKRYAWCTCGLSENQPFCDGKHKPTSFTPQVFIAEESKTAYFCTCKQTGNPGFCDGSHKTLS